MIQPPAVTPLEGFPDQMASDRYAIDAKTESPQSMGMMRGPMMQRLLEDRFHLKVHHEIREVPVYIMTVAKDGLKLQATKEDSCSPAEAQDVIQAYPALPASKPPCGFAAPPAKNGTHFVFNLSGITVGTFSKLFKIGGLPVIDHTGLTGTFDIHLEWESSPPLESGSAGEAPDTTIVSSIRKQLGLQLSPGKGPREFLVIDRLERPSQN